MIIKNGMIHDCVSREPYRADILLRDGKIAAIGHDLGDDPCIEKRDSVKDSCPSGQ